MPEPDTEMINNMVDESASTKPEPTPDPAPKKESGFTPQTQRFKVVVNGQEKEVDASELIAHAQKHMAGEDKLREAAEQIKAAKDLEDLVSRAYNRENPDPDAVLALMEKQGYTQEEIAETRRMLTEQVDDADPTPEPQPKRQPNQEVDEVKRMIWQERLDHFIESTRDAIDTNPVIQDIEKAIRDLDDAELRSEWDAIRDSQMKRLIKDRAKDIDEDKWSLRNAKKVATEIADAIADKGKRLRLTSSTLGRGNRVAEAEPLPTPPSKPKATGDRDKDRKDALDYIDQRLKHHTQSLSRDSNYKALYNRTFYGA